jgi:hypothetical protein
MVFALGVGTYISATAGLYPDTNGPLHSSGGRLTSLQPSVRYFSQCASALVRAVRGHRADFLPRYYGVSPLSSAI